MRLVVAITLTILTIFIAATVSSGCSNNNNAESVSDADVKNNAVSSLNNSNGSISEAGPQVGRLAPDFSFTNDEGMSVALSNLRGKPVMLNFWATWCGPCKAEIPLIQKLAHDNEKLDRGLILLTINSGDPADKVRGFMSANGLSFPVLLDTQKIIVRAYNVRGIPTSFFIDRDGVIREIKIGAFTSEEDLDVKLDKIIE